MKHRVKLNVNFASAVYNGSKCFEVRKNDRGYQKGDEIEFEVIDDSFGVKKVDHLLNNVTFEITYVLSGWGIEDGYVVFGIRRKEP